MTTIANKYGLRAAANERRNKHAQKTPLPARPETLAANRELAEELKSVDGEGQRMAAKPKGSKSHQAASASAGQPELPPLADDARTAKSAAKASGFVTKVTAIGWEARTANPEPGVIEILATRGDEAIFIAWSDGRLIDRPMPTYTIAHRTIQLRNASQAIQFAGRAPETASKELARVAANKSFKKRAPADAPARYLPFDPGTALDEEILDRVRGAKVSWQNDLTNSEETAVLSASPKFLRIQEMADGERVIWCCSDSGFRAFRVSALTRVMGGSAK